MFNHFVCNYLRGAIIENTFESRFGSGTTEVILRVTDTIIGTQLNYLMMYKLIVLINRPFYFTPVKEISM